MGNRVAAASLPLFLLSFAYQRQRCRFHHELSKPWKKSFQGLENCYPASVPTAISDNERPFVLRIQDASGGVLANLLGKIEANRLIALTTDADAHP